MDRPTCFKRLAEADLRTQNGKCSSLRKRYVNNPPAVDLRRECACESVFADRRFNPSFVPKECNSRYLKRQTDMRFNDYHRCCGFAEDNKSLTAPPTYTIQLNVLRNKKAESKSKSFLGKICTTSSTKSRHSCEPQRSKSKCEQCDDLQKERSKFNKLRLRDRKIDPITPRPNYVRNKSNQPHDVQKETKGMPIKEDKPQITQYFCCGSLLPDQTSHSQNISSTERHPVCSTRANVVTIPRGNLISDTNKDINIGVIKIIDKYVQNDNATCKPCKKDLEGKFKLRNSQQNTDSRFLERGFSENSSEEKKKRKSSFWSKITCRVKSHKELSTSSVQPSIHKAADSEVSHNCEMINATTQYAECYCSQNESRTPSKEPCVAITREPDVPIKVHTTEVTTQYSPQNLSHPLSMQPSVALITESDISQKIQTMNATTQCQCPNLDTTQKEPYQPSMQPSVSTHEAKNINPTSLYLSYFVQTDPPSMLTPSSPSTQKPHMVSAATQCGHLDRNPKESLRRLTQPCTTACIKHERQKVSVATQCASFDLSRNEPSSPLIQPYITTPVKHPPDKIQTVNVATQCDNLPLPENKSPPPFIQPYVLTHDKLNIPHQKQTMNVATQYEARDYRHKEKSLTTKRKLKDRCPSRKRSKVSPKRSRRTLCCKREPKRKTNETPQSSVIQPSISAPFEPEIKVQKVNVTPYTTTPVKHPPDKVQTVNVATQCDNLPLPENKSPPLFIQPYDLTHDKLNIPHQKQTMNVATQYVARDYRHKEKSLTTKRKLKDCCPSRKRSKVSPKRSRKTLCCKRKPERKTNETPQSSVIQPSISAPIEAEIKAEKVNVTTYLTSELHQQKDICPSENDQRNKDDHFHQQKDSCPVENNQRYEDDLSLPRELSKPSPKKKKNFPCCKRNSRRKFGNERSSFAKLPSSFRSKKPVKERQKVSVAKEHSSRDHSQRYRGALNFFKGKKGQRSSSRERSKDSPKRKKKMLCCKRNSKKKSSEESAPSAVLTPITIYNEPSVKSQNLDMLPQYSSWGLPQSERHSVHNYQRMTIDKEPLASSIQPSSSKYLESQLPHETNKVNASTQCDICNHRSFICRHRKDARIPSKERSSSKRKKITICCKRHSKKNVGIQTSFSIPIKPNEPHRDTLVTTQDYKPQLTHYASWDHLERSPTLISRKIPCSCLVQPPQSSQQSTILSPPTYLDTLPTLHPLITQPPQLVLPSPSITTPTSKMSSQPTSPPQTSSTTPTLKMSSPPSPPQTSTSTVPSVFKPSPSTNSPKFTKPSKPPEPVAKPTTPTSSLTSSCTFKSSASPLSFSLYSRKESHSDVRISSPGKHKITTKTRTIEEIRMKIYKTKFREPNEGKSSNYKNFEESSGFLSEQELSNSSNRDKAEDGTSE